MIEASVGAAQLDRRLDEARNADSLWPVLRQWSGAAEALDEAVERASPALQREGTPKDQIDRIRERLDHLEQRSRQFDLDFDLDDCVETWSSLGHDFAQLSGGHRDTLVLLLRHHRPAIDQATALLAEAQRHEGLLREQHRKVVGLQTDRDRARAKYERLRQAYLGAQREWEAAQRQEEAQIPAQQHEVKKPPLPDLRVLRDERPSPLIVRLPVPKEGGPKSLPPFSRPAAIAMRSAPKLVATKKAEEKKPASPRKPRGPAMFARAQPKAPPHLRPRPHATAAEHHLARFDHVLGPLLFEARAVRQGKLQLHRLLDRDHQQRNVVAARLERTLSHLATAAQRTLTDPNAGQLRAHLAQMDSVLARLPGKGREELLEGAHAVSSILQRMHAIAARAGGASHIAGFRELIEERKVELQRIARAQPAAELSRSGATGLNALAQKPQAGRGAAGRAGPGGRLQAQRAAHLGGGHGVGLGALAGPQGALGKALGKQHEHRLRPGRPEETARILGEGSPRTGLRELAEKERVGPRLPCSAGGLADSDPREQPRGRRAARHQQLRERRIRHRAHDLTARRPRARCGPRDRRSDGVRWPGHAARGGGRRPRHGRGRPPIRTCARASRLRWCSRGARGGELGPPEGGRGGGLDAPPGARCRPLAGEKVHSGLEWAKKTGVVGAVGTGLRRGLSFVKSAAEHTPLGYAVRKGYGFVKSGGLTKVWNATRHVAGQAWAGLKGAYQATSRFLQSPAGQLLVTGLSLAASFIPGGIVVKAE